MTTEDKLTHSERLRLESLIQAQTHNMGREETAPLDQILADGERIATFLAAVEETAPVPRGLISAAAVADVLNSPPPVGKNWYVAMVDALHALVVQAGEPQPSEADLDKLRRQLKSTAPVERVSVTEAPPSIIGAQALRTLASRWRDLADMNTDKGEADARRACASDLIELLSARTGS